jgi:CheY-like chemotaxis protein
MNMSTQNKKRILVVDDEKSITRLVRLNLEQTGKYEVREENSATHVLTAACEFHPDLILLDVVMPEMDGGIVASRVREHPALETVPIVFLTAAATKQEVASHFGKIGGWPFLAKPVEAGELTACLDKHLIAQA